MSLLGSSLSCLYRIIIIIIIIIIFIITIIIITIIYSFHIDKSIKI